MTDRISGDILAALPEEIIDLVRALIDKSRAKGATLYLVGGPVRDWLLGEVISDVDLLIEGGPAKTPETLARNLSGPEVQIREHPRFGTLTLAVGDHTLDLASLRKEEYAHDGALPRVSPGTLEDDLLRRDFSINALALPLRSSRDGDESSVSDIIDIVDGLADLADRTLRVLHPKSFHDDPTRVLRAVRLSTRLGLRLSRGSRSYLRDALRDGVFGRVSGDRLRREFEKLFSDARRGGRPAVALERLESWHVLGAIEPGLILDPRAKPALRRLGKLIANPAWRPREYRPWVAGLCLWLAPLSPAMRRRTIKRLSIRGDVGGRIVDFAKARSKWIKALEGTRGRGAVDVVLSQLDEEQLVALCASCEPLLRRRVVRWAAEDRDRRIPVSGRDLVNAKLEGPVVGAALSRIRSAFLDGEVANREEAMALAREFQRTTTARQARRKKPKKPSQAKPKPQ
ncbi:MAG: CCA tRNA nucleotidyltransferase [Deltaproteobacteria bacterium]|nr:CCA tRNA nucleotidyltransferase [Deltaproteobacteria bacterium]MBW2724010.1 CCA tRNA nucleotidyltransferase [Deltaproteobacteria bacterium]